MAGGNWSDLGPRATSAIVMSVVGLFAIWMGGWIFAVLVAVATGLIVWEITNMLAPEGGLFEGPGVIGAMAGIAILVAFNVTGGAPGLAALLILIAAALLGLLMLGHNAKDGGRFVLYTAWVMIAGYGLIMLRANGGMSVIFWLVLVVIATDTAGYFAGKTFGGPKFWPAVSPKKTWSGTIAGWVAAGIVGLFFGGFGLMLISALLAFASQMGDAAESALKRYTGIKDSSNLIPGHGGVFDRFDALMGASLVITLAALLGWAGLLNG